MIDDYSGGNSELFKLVIVIRTNHLSVNTAVEIVNCLIIVMGRGGGGGGHCSVNTAIEIVNCLN